MSYYDDPIVNIHASIAGIQSEITNLRYVYARLMSSIMPLPIEEIPIESAQRQLDIVRQIQQKRLAIQMLEAELTAFTNPTPQISDNSLASLIANQTVQQVPEQLVEQVVEQVPESTLEPVPEQITESVPE